MDKEVKLMKDWMKSVFTDGSRYFVSNPLPKKGETITLWLRICEWSPVRQILLRTKQNGEEAMLPMEWGYSRNGLAYFKTSATLWEDRFSYHFYLECEDWTYYYDQRGISDTPPDETADFVILTDYQQPEWVKEAVFYQIFPDRFCNGNTANDVSDSEYSFEGYPSVRVKDWDQIPSGYWDSHCLDFYGGDLDGIIRKIPYLKKMGVNALYLNPIFWGATVHKYDCIDYFQVDPHLGGNRALVRLSQALHANAMRLILDISINHTGTAHKWFNKDAQFFPEGQGAFQDPDGPEREYYFFDENGKYLSWHQVESLPVLNYTSKKLRGIIYQNEDSVIKTWLKAPYEIDGWRFDVANEVGRFNLLQLQHEIWPQIRESIKKENPQAYILGEDWLGSSEFVQGNEWDSAMNYAGCARPIREFAGERDLLDARHQCRKHSAHPQDAAYFAGRISAFLNKLPTVICQNQFNLLDSHDTSRLHNNPEISLGAWKNAVLLQFALPGCVSIYYGDEAGIGGRTQDVEGCRYPMPWNSDFQNRERYQHYVRLIQIRKESPAFTEGSFQILYAFGLQFACVRFTDSERFLFVCSMEKAERTIEIYLQGLGDWKISESRDLLGQTFVHEDLGGWIKLDMPPESGYLIRLDEPS